MLLTQKIDTRMQRYIVNGVSIAMVAALLALFYTMFMPKLRGVFSMSDKIKKGREIIPNPESYSEERQKVTAQIEALKKKIEGSKEKLFWKKDMALFLEKLNNIGEQLSLDFISIKPNLASEPIKSEENKDVVLMYRNPINITMKTGYRELIGFLKRIEDSDKFLRIDELDISADKQDNFKRDVKMILSIFTAD